MAGPFEVCQNNPSLSCCVIRQLAPGESVQNPARKPCALNPETRNPKTQSSSPPIRSLWSGEPLLMRLCPPTHSLFVRSGFCQGWLSSYNIQPHIKRQLNRGNSRPQRDGSHLSHLLRPLCQQCRIAGLKPINRTVYTNTTGTSHSSGASRTNV